MLIFHAYQSFMYLPYFINIITVLFKYPGPYKIDITANR
jgi:hypothetical protein